MAKYIFSYIILSKFISSFNCNQYLSYITPNIHIPTGNIIKDVISDVTIMLDARLVSPPIFWVNIYTLLAGGTENKINKVIISSKLKFIFITSGIIITGCKTTLYNAIEATFFISSFIKFSRKLVP